MIFAPEVLNPRQNWTQHCCYCCYHCCCCCCCCCGYRRCSCFRCCLSYRSKQVGSYRLTPQSAELPRQGSLVGGALIVKAYFVSERFSVALPTALSLLKLSRLPECQFQMPLPNAVKQHHPLTTRPMCPAQSLVCNAAPGSLLRRWGSVE